MEGGREIGAELLQPGASEASVERKIFSCSILQPGWTKIVMCHQEATAEWTEATAEWISGDSRRRFGFGPALLRSITARVPGLCSAGALHVLFDALPCSTKFNWE